MSLSKPTLVIGDKHLSSWSLRPWLAMKVAGVDFNEVVIKLNQPDTAANIRKYSPTGKVPVLIDGDTVVWESLAIAAHVAEVHLSLWPNTRAARGHARSICNEMHAGFLALRVECPMNLNLKHTGTVLSDAAKRDLARITTIWTETRARFGHRGPFLFGSFTIADAMYAPVTTRITSYGLAVDDVSRAYIEAVQSLPAFVEWKAAAALEGGGS